MKAEILINKLFTVNSLNQLIYDQNYALYKKTAFEILDDPQSHLSNLEIFDLIYKFMAKKHRNEYFYKNVLLNKILLGRHSLTASTAIRELPVAGNILDFLIINGIGQVYEIKTELDNLI